MYFRINYSVIFRSSIFYCSHRCFLLKSIETPVPGVLNSLQKTYQKNLNLAVAVKFKKSHTFSIGRHLFH